MKTITRKFRLPLGLLFSSVFLISCLETKENEVAEVTIEQPAVEAASQKYADIVQESLNVMQDFNFDGLGTYFANDVQWYWPNGGMETRSIIKGKENVINFWKTCNSTTLILCLLKLTNQLINIMSLVLSYCTMVTLLFMVRLVLQL